MSAGAQGASARGMNHLSGYRKFLLSLSRNLSITDLEELKFACSDDVPRGKREEVTAGFMLFDILEQKGRITPQNLTFLEDMMFTIERNDLGLEVNRFMEDKRKEMKSDVSWEIEKVKDECANAELNQPRMYKPQNCYESFFYPPPNQTSQTNHHVNYTDDDVPDGRGNEDAFNYSEALHGSIDEGDEVVHNEVTDDLEKKAPTICFPMDQLLDHGFCGILMKTGLPDIYDVMKRFNIIHLWNNAVTYKEQEAIEVIMRMFKNEDIETQCVIKENRIDLYFKNYKLAIVCDKNAHKHMDSYKEEELKGRNLGCKFIRFNPDQLFGFKIIDVLSEINEFIMKEKEAQRESEFTNDKYKICNTGKCYDENHQMFKNVFEVILRMFKNEDIVTQHVIEGYRIDLYFKRYKLAIECEENSTTQVDSDKEKRRQEFIEKNLVCKFIRFNPDQSGFKIIDVLSEITEFIMKEKEEQWKSVIANAGLEIKKIFKSLICD